MLKRTLGLALLLMISFSANAGHYKHDHKLNKFFSKFKSQPVQLGPRPFFLVEDMDDGQLKKALKQCENGPFYKSDFSIGHRGAPMQFPEHTKESYEAAAKMGAGIIECDVTFTKDRQLVCRHSQCDLHTTTDILARPELAAKCSGPFTPADPINGTPASATSSSPRAQTARSCLPMPAPRITWSWMPVLNRWRRSRSFLAKRAPFFGTAR